MGAGTGLVILPRFTTRPRPDLVTRPLADVRSARTLVALARPALAPNAPP